MAKIKLTFINSAALIIALALAAVSVRIHKSNFFGTGQTGSGAGGGVSGGDYFWDSLSAEQAAGFAENQAAKLTLSGGERLAAALELGGAGDEQVVAYYAENAAASPVYFAQIRFDETRREYVRKVTLPSAATAGSTVSLFTNDLLGDHSVCVLLSGLNDAGDHTLTIFHKKDNAGEVFTKIGEFIIDGTISVNETERGVNYERGVSNGRSFTISTRGRDTESPNEMDKIEITYRFDAAENRYIRERAVALPGAVIDSQRQREILSGGRANFEKFTAGLWYFVQEGGGISSRQYVYLDPVNREITFYADDTQEVFAWLNAAATRYGLYLTTSNISVTTLKRFVDIELESLDSIRLKIFEDVRLKIAVDTQWDGSYRRAPPLKDITRDTPAARVAALIDEEFESSLGKVYFNANGEYRIVHDTETKKGKYTFFLLGNETLLELKPDPLSGLRKAPREVYLAARDGSGLVLSRARIGTKRIEKYNEASIALYSAARATAP